MNVCIQQKEYYKVIVLLFCLLFINNAVNAATIKSNNVTGNWSATATWNGGVVPTTGDSVVITGASAIVTVDVNATVKSVYINTNATGCFVVASGITLTITGTIDCTTITKSIFKNSAGTFLFTGSSSTNVVSSNMPSDQCYFSNITFDPGVGVTLNVNGIVETKAGTLLVNSGTVNFNLDIRCNPETADANTNTITIAAGATANLVGSSSRIRGTSTSTTYYDGNLNIYGNLTAGTSSYINVVGTITIGASGVFKTSYAGTNGWWNTTKTPGAVNVTSGGTINFSGVSQIIPIYNYQNLILSGTGTMTVAASPLTVGGNLTINSGDSLVASAGAQITVSGSTTVNGVFQLNGSSSSQATFIDNGTISGTGTFNMQRYFVGAGGGTPSDRAYYVSSPLASATSNVFTATTNDLWSYSEAGFAFTQISNNVTSLGVMGGYATRMGTSGTVTFTGGAFNTGTISNSSLSRTGTSNGKRGYNLVGNPYPSYVSWDAASTTNLSTTLWYRTVNGSDVMLFDTYNSSGDIGTNNNGSGAVTRYIAPMQAFWVRVSADGQTGTLSFANANRSHQSSIALLAAEPQQLVRLQISDGSSKDEAIVNFNGDALNGLDNFDSEKMFASGIPQVYTNVGQTDLVINGLTDVESNPIVPLIIQVPSAGQYSFNATQVAGFDNQKAYLQDQISGTIQDLSVNPNYTFTTTSGTTTDRFNLLFGEAVATSVINATKNKFNVYQNNGNIIVNAGNNNTGVIRIYDINGKEMFNQNIINPVTSINLEISEGLYFVSLQGQEGLSTQKIVITK